jgi:tetrahydromethanopterin S-methyltransferase subunit G
MSDGNGRFDWLKEDMAYIRRRVDEVVKMQAAQCATQRGHGKQIAWLYGIVAAVIVLLVASFVGAR